jgi:hypothetical protein
VRVDESFIGATGVGETTERRLWEAGVTHWDRFEPSELGSARASGVREFIDRGRTALDDGDVGFFAERFPSQATWRLYETFPDRACFFDIETTGLDHRSSVVTTVTCHQAGETTTLVRGDDLTAERLAALFADADLLVTFNGKRFDVPFLEACFDVELSRPHLDLLYPCRRLGLTGGLDAIERAVGIDREGPDVSGEDAVRLWREHERGRDGALETLVAYNRDDTENMVDLVEHVTDALHAEVFAGEETA